MDATKHALVLTGEALPGFDANTVWPALASYFRMEPDRLRSDLLARAPITIKESEDLGKLRNLQDGASTIGAVTDLVAMGSEGNMFVLVDGTPRGPVPQAFVANRVRSGAWPSSISVAEVGSTNWRPFVVPGASPAAPDYDQQATVAFSTIRGADISPAQPAAAAAAPAAAPAMRMSAANPGPAVAAQTGPMASGQLPEGGIVHAGFWRRFAAYTVDSFVIMIPFLLVFGLLAYMSVRAAMSGEGPGGLIIALYFLAYIGAIVGSWLYFAKFESGASQATPGKRIMGLKVTDISGERIRFGRATGRFFGKIVTGIIPFGIGWMLAGWTGRKQALHDMMASTCVVFREVSPGKPLPTARPPMPWYGWVLNGLPILCMVIMLASYTWLIGSLIGAAGTQMQDSSMSSGLPDMSGSGMPDMGGMSDSSSMSSGADAQEQETVRNGLTPVFTEASMIQSEIAGAVDGGGECPTEERSSSNAWIESIQLGGVTPECTLTVRLSSSSDIPFAARIERIEWSYQGGGNWRCQSSMSQDLLPFSCN
jgi:uncharacterized RDD family membrane protein YckC